MLHSSSYPKRGTNSHVRETEYPSARTASVAALACWSRSVVDALSLKPETLVARRRPGFGDFGEWQVGTVNRAGRLQKEKDVPSAPTVDARAW
jgi:hypothetical protein